MQSMSPSLASLAPYLPYIAVVLALAASAIVVLTVLYVSRQNRQKPPPPPPPRAARPARAAAPPEKTIPPDPTAAERRQASTDMQAATKQLLGADLVYEHPYSVPWFVVLGPPEANPQRLTDALDPADPGNPEHNAISAHGYRIAFAREGTIVEVDPVLLDAPNWSERWKHLLAFLRRARPERPADGIVLAVPVDWLTGSSALPADRLADRGTQLYESIWDFQKHTGMRVPVYLVLTGADHLRGFASLMQTLPGDHHDEMLGWATPDAMSEEFDPERIDRALDSLVTGLSAFELQLFGSAESGASRSRRQAQPGDLFLLSADIRGLAAPLRTFLTALLRASVYHEPFLFRGFFLTGAAIGTRDPSDEAFASGLFHRKIFREFQMARPARGIVTARNRRLRIAQATLAAILLFSVVGLIAVQLISADIAEKLKPSLDILAELTAAAPPSAATDPDRDGIPGLADEDAPARAIEARRLLLAYNKLPIRTAMLLSPASFLEDSNNRVIAALSVGYGRFVLDALKDALELKGKLIFYAISSPRPEDCGNATPAGAQLISADQFRDGIASLQTLGENIRIYSDLGRTEKISELQSLANYALNFQLPSDFDQNTNLYQAALSRTRPHNIDLAGLRDSLHDALLRAFIAAAARQYDVSLTANALTDIHALTGRIDANGAADAASVEQLRNLRDRLAAIDATGGGESPAGPAPLGSTLDGALDQLRSANLAFVPPAFIAELEAQGQICRRAAQRNLASLTGPGGAILDDSGDTVRLSKPYHDLSLALNAVFAEDFMNSRGANPAAGAGGGDQRINWNVSLVDAAQQAYERYKQIMSGSTGDAPPEITNAVQAVAAYHLAGFVQDRVLAARQPMGNEKTEDARRAEIRSFAAVAPLLTSLARGMSDIGQTRTGSQILAIGSAQARSLLGEVSRQFGDDRLYMPVGQGFSWWNGTDKLSLQSFGVGGSGDLAAWLATQRATASALALDEAKPLITYLDSNPEAGDSLDATKWSNTIHALDLYTAKEPNNSLTALENFILTGMDQITQSNCRDVANIPVSVSDYFGESLWRLKTDLGKRCSTLQQSSIADQYRQLADLFNATLAGRFPFSAGGKIKSWAEPDDVRKFYKLFDNGIVSASGTRTFVGAPQAAFIAQMETLRPLLAPLVADAQDQLPAWAAEIEFRAVRNIERAGNQVLELSLDSGGTHVSSLQDKPVLVWSFGQPITLTARWAENAPSIPAPAGGQALIKDVSASWTYDNPWALFAMLADHNALHDPTLPAAAHRPETMVLTVPLMKNPQAAQGGDSTLSSALLFVRMRLRALEHVPGQPDKRTPVIISRFPTAAP